MIRYLAIALAFCGTPTLAAETPAETQAERMVEAQINVIQNMSEPELRSTLLQQADQLETTAKTPVQNGEPLSPETQELLLTTAEAMRADAQQSEPGKLKDRILDGIRNGATKVGLASFTGVAYAGRTAIVIVFAPLIFSGKFLKAVFLGEKEMDDTLGEAALTALGMGVILVGYLTYAAVLAPVEIPALIGMIGDFIVVEPICSRTTNADMKESCKNSETLAGRAIEFLDRTGTNSGLAIHNGFWKAIDSIVKTYRKIEEDTKKAAQTPGGFIRPDPLP